MRKVLGWVMSGIVLGLLWVGVPGAVEPGKNISVEKELKSIREELQAIKNSLEEIKTGIAEKPGTPPSAPPAQGKTPRETVVSLDDDPVLGSPEASLILIEFSDYQCPFCGRFFRNTLSEIRKEYIDTGKLRHVFRDYPLPFHAQAPKASEAANCAGDQGKYWEMHDRLFQSQNALFVDRFKDYAKEMGLNTETFNACLDGGTYAEEIRKDLADGDRAGVSGTPSFFLGITEDGKTIRGRSIVGAKPFASFQKEIDELLSQ